MAQLHEFRKLGGLAEIPVGAERIHFIAVVLRVRRCDDKDDGIGAAAACTQPAQYVTAFVAGHVDVEKDEVRTGRRLIGIRMLEKPDRLLTVIGCVNLRVDPRFSESLPDQEDIGLVVLSNQNMPRTYAGSIRPGE
jgi:hypothetical protein